MARSEQVNVPLPSRVAAPRRRGVGMLLIVILILVTVMTFMALARAFFSKGVTSQVLRSSMGIQAQTLAESAAEELLLELRRRVNDPTHEIFEPFRAEVYAGEESFIPVRTLETPRFDSLYERFPDINGFYLDGREAVVNFQRQFSAVPYERFGLVKVRATVSRDLSFTNRVSRQVELGVEFKVQLLSTPRPFDQTALYVHEGHRLLRRPYQAVEDVLQAIEFRRSEHEDVVDRLQAEKGSLPFNGDAMLSRFENLIIPEADYWREKAPPLREPAVVFALGRAPDGVALEQLRLESRVRDAEEAKRRAEEAFQEARGELEADFQRQDRHVEYLTQLKVLLGAYSELVGQVERFRGLFKVWDGGQYGALEPFAYKLQPEEWRRKATFVLDRDPAQRPPQAVLNEKLRDPDGLYGVFYSNWPGKSISLRGKAVKGRAILVAEETTLNLSDVGAAGPEDLLTIVSFGQLNLSGRIRASVLALGSVSIEPGTRIEGNLILREARNLGELRGEVVHDPKYYSGRTTASSTAGARTQYYWVTVAPRPIYKAVHRK